MSGPPAHLVRDLLMAPGLISDLEWHDEIDSTNRRAAELASDGADEGCAVLADVQTAGRGRHGRSWRAPAGTSLMLSLVLRPPVGANRLPLLPLLAGLALAEAAEQIAPVPAALKWPNDLLVAERKAAGILCEALTGAVIVGMGINVDWRGVARPPELAQATSLAEVVGQDVDRWELLAALSDALGRRYADWREDASAFLSDYRRRCATIGRHVRLQRPGGAAISGIASGVSADGRLEVDLPDGRHESVAAAAVTHVRVT